MKLKLIESRKEEELSYLITSMLIMKRKFSTLLVYFWLHTHTHTYTKAHIHTKKIFSLTTFSVLFFAHKVLCTNTSNFYSCFFWKSFLGHMVGKITFIEAKLVVLVKCCKNGSWKVVFSRSLVALIRIEETQVDCWNALKSLILDT